MSGGSAVPFFSWNVRSMNGPVKRARIFTHLKRLHTEIAFLQETPAGSIPSTTKKSLGRTGVPFKL